MKVGMLKEQENKIYKIFEKRSKGGTQGNQ